MCVAGVANLLVLEPFVLAAVHMDVVISSTNLQQEKCYSPFCNFFSRYEWKGVMPLKVRALRIDSPVYFRLEATFFSK